MDTLEILNSLHLESNIKLDEIPEIDLYMDQVIQLFESKLSEQKRKEDEKPLETKITKKEISVTDRTKDIRNILRDKKKVSFFDLFEVKTREYVVVTFLSILEMAKFGEINIIQENNFNNIVVSLKEGEVNE